MKEVAWIFGTSASGKETFIRNAANNQPALEALGWMGRPLAACQSSLKYIGQFDGDPIIEHRRKILEEVPLLLDSVEVVLIKWQSVDSWISLPQKLREGLPGVRHRIIELRASLPELEKRLKQKPWWTDYGHEKEFIGEELEEVSRTTKDLKGFDITVLSSSEADNYSKLAPPGL